MKLNLPAKWVEAERSRLIASRRAFTFERWIDDPVGYFQNVLRVDPWSRQKDLLNAVARHDRIGVRSGQKTSKSNSAAGLALWYASTRRGARVFCLAPTFMQVKNIIWRELRLRASPVTAVLGGKVPLDPASGIEFANGSQIIGLSTNQRENLAGLSSPGGIFFIIDEASGFPDELFHVVRGNSAGGAKILAISNPTLRSDCTWYPELFRSSVWHTLRISSEETPNVVHQKELIKGLAGWGWILEMREEYGPDYMNHPEYMIRVLGEFAAVDEETIMTLEEVTAAQERWDPDAKCYGPLGIGVDPARYGVDPTGIAAARGDHCYTAHELSGRLDGFDIARAALEAAERYRRSSDGLVAINIDAVGPGAAAVDATRHLANERNAQVVVNEHEGFRKANDEDQFANRRAEVLYKTADWVRNAGQLPPGDKLRAELLSFRREHDLAGRRAVEAKERTKRRGKGSPNCADALSLAVTSTAPLTMPEYEHDHEELRSDARWI